MRLPSSSWSSLVAIVALTACTSATDPFLESPPRLDSLPRPLTASERTVVGAANGFSFALFRQVSAAQPGANVFTSPLSASMALGMAMNGAAGATWDEMRATLGFGTATEPEIDEGYRSLMTLLRGLDPAVEMQIANSIWYRSGFPVTPAFLDAGKTWFDAEPHELDFASPAAVATINGWVSRATAGKIPTIVDTIDGNTMLYLIDAIYFKAGWRTRFAPEQTRDALFHATGGDQPMRLMSRHGEIDYLETADFQAVDLPYGNGAFAMSVLLPRAGLSADALAAQLDPARWTEWTGRFHGATVDLALPKFRLAWERTLNDDLIALGMRRPFGAADFSRMSSRRDLFISAVKQKTYVDVDEEGTEAAAVTSVEMTVTSLPQSVAMRVDRPFLLVLRERFSGTVLFIGKVASVTP